MNLDKKRIWLARDDFVKNGNSQSIVFQCTQNRGQEQQDWSYGQFKKQIRVRRLVPSVSFMLIVPINPSDPEMRVVLPSFGRKPT